MATEHRLNEQPPDVIYLDADFLIKAIVGREEHHAACEQFTISMIEHSTRVVFSVALWFDFWQGWRRIFKKGLLLPTEHRQQTLAFDDQKYLQHSHFHFR